MGKVKNVRAQYESYPYPPRDPQDEKEILFLTVGDNLDEINHICYGGRKEYNEEFRALVAGGGTGDSLIYLAEQLKDSGSKVIYLDMSEASMSIAKARAEVRGLTNIEWHQGSLLELDKMSLGEFDFINCSGVLHHIESPIAGLKALESALSEGGSMFLMLYAKHGRYAIYMMQELLRKLTKGIKMVDKIKFARDLIADLPSSNYFKEEMDIWGPEIKDEGFGDSGLYDLLLHDIDRSYDVDELYELLGDTELKLIRFWGNDNLTYHPNMLIPDQSLWSLWQDKTQQEQYSIAEKIHGMHIQHKFFVSRNADCSASLNDKDLRIVLTRELTDQHMAIHDALIPGQAINLDFQTAVGNKRLTMNANEINKCIFKHLDGTQTINSIIQAVLTECPETTEQGIIQELQFLLDSLFPLKMLLLLK